MAGNIGIHVEGGENYLEGNKVDGYDTGIKVTGHDSLYAIGNEIIFPSEHNVEELKEFIVTQIEELIAQSKQEPNGLQKVLGFFAPVAQEVIAGYINTKYGIK